MTQYRTMLLDSSAWDLVLDSQGNIAVADPPYALAQDVASACRLFAGELYYDVGKGVPYFTDTLGHLPPPAVVIGHLETAALTVPGVVSAKCVVERQADRTIRGELRFVDETGAENGVNL